MQSSCGEVHPRARGGECFGGSLLNEIPGIFFLCEMISSTLGSRTYEMFCAPADPVILKPSCAALEMIAEVLRLLVESLGLAMVEGLRSGWKTAGTLVRFDALKTSRSPFLPATDHFGREHLTRNSL